MGPPEHVVWRAAGAPLRLRERHMLLGGRDELGCVLELQSPKSLNSLEGPGDQVDFLRRGPDGN
eukprot:9492617-Pyramimonas_sp.AAC.1